MKSTLTASEYADAPRDIRDAVDAWLEKIGMLDAGVIEIRVVNRLKGKQAVVAIAYFQRDEDCRFVRDARNHPVIAFASYEGDAPPLGFFRLVNS